MVDHAQAQVFEVCVVFQGAPFAGDDDWQIVCIGLAQAQLGIGRFETVGAAQQIDFAVAQGCDRRMAAGKAPDLYRYLQKFGY
ncbi:hypothetical protein D3C79_793720 [compost metagenome]